MAANQAAVNLAKIPVKCVIATTRTEYYYCVVCPPSDKPIHWHMGMTWELDSSPSWVRPSGSFDEAASNGDLLPARHSHHPDTDW